MSPIEGNIEDNESAHIIQYYPHHFRDTTQNKNDTKYSRNLFQYSKEDELDEKTLKILKLDLSTEQGRKLTAEYFGIQDEIEAIEKLRKDGKISDITKIQDEFYKARWEKARTEKEDALIFVAEEGQHRLLLWAALHSGSQYSPKQPYLKHGSIDTEFLRKNNLHMLQGFNAESDLICKENDLNVYEILEKQLEEDDGTIQDKAKYNPLRSMHIVSIRYMRAKSGDNSIFEKIREDDIDIPDQDVQKRLNEIESSLEAKVVLRLIRTDSEYCKKDKYDTSHINVMDTVISQVQFISERMSSENQYYEPSFKKSIDTFDNPNKIRKEKEIIDDNISQADYLEKIPDPRYLTNENIQNYITSPSDAMAVVNITEGTFHDPEGKKYDSEKTKDRRHIFEHGAYVLEEKGHITPFFNNTFESMSKMMGYSKETETIHMSTQIANKIVAIPPFLLATMKNTDEPDEARVAVTRYFLKYHICPWATEYPKLAPQSKLYDFKGNTSKDIFTRGFESVTTALFLEKLLNAILSFDGTVQRFIDMCTTLNQDEISLTSGVFKERMGKYLVCEISYGDMSEFVGTHKKIPFTMDSLFVKILISEISWNQLSLDSRLCKIFIFKILWNPIIMDSRSRKILNIEILPIQFSHYLNDSIT